MIVCIGSVCLRIGEVSAEDLKLTEKELAVAEEVSVDPQVLAMLKEAGCSELAKVDLNEGLWSNETRLDGLNQHRQLQRFMLAQPDPNWPKTEKNLRRIMKKYPELEAVIADEYLPRIAPNPKFQEQLRRAAEFREVMKPFRAYLQQQRDEILLKRGASRDGWAISVSPDTTPEQLSKMLHDEFDGKPLAEKYNPKPLFGLRAYVVLTPDQLEKSKTRFGMAETVRDQLVRRLQRDLNSKGYGIYGGPLVRDSELFSSESAAQEFLKQHQIPECFARITRKEPSSLPYSFKRGADLTHFAISEDADIEKSPDGEWKILDPERFHLEVEFPSIFVVNRSGEHSVNQFDFVRLAGVQAVNYGISEERIVEQLRKWDEQFGIQVISASDRLIVRFLKLPTEDSTLLDELFKLCPEIVYNTDPPMPHVVQRFRKEFRETQEVSFWWD